MKSNFAFTLTVFSLFSLSGCHSTPEPSASNRRIEDTSQPHSGTGSKSSAQIDPMAKVANITIMRPGMKRPGPVEIPHDRDLYLLEVISKIGGHSRVGSPKIQITRLDSNGKAQLLEIDVSKIGPMDVRLEPNDVIWLGEL